MRFFSSFSSRIRVLVFAPRYNTSAFRGAPINYAAVHAAFMTTAEGCADVPARPGRF